MIKKQFTNSPIKISSPIQSCKNQQFTVQKVNTAAVKISAFSNSSQSIITETSPQRNKNFFSPSKQRASKQIVHNNSQLDDKYFQLVVDNEHICKQNSLLQDYLDKQLKNYDLVMNQIQEENLKLKQQNYQIVAELRKNKCASQDVVCISRLELAALIEKNQELQSLVDNQLNQSQSSNRKKYNKMLPDKNNEFIHDILKQLNLSNKKNPTQIQNIEQQKEYPDEPLKKQVQALADQVEQLKELALRMQQQYNKDKNQWIKEIGILSQDNNYKKQQYESFCSSLERPDQNEVIYCNGPPIWVPFNSMNQPMESSINSLQQTILLQRK